VKTYLARVDTQSILTLPEEIVKNLDLHEGDEANIRELENGNIEITFSKMETVEIDISPHMLFQATMLAHEQNITLNQLITNIIREEINKYEKPITVKELEDGEKFDEVMDDVVDGATYIIYEDEEHTKPMAVMVPIGKFDNFEKGVKG
jgi:antitoxin component of MazEF toxin-antitoxin module